MADISLQLKQLAAKLTSADSLHFLLKPFQKIKIKTLVNMQHTYIYTHITAEFISGLLLSL